MKNKKRKNILLLILLLLGISIGFAALSTTLKIIGTTNISKNTWNIYWENKSVNQNGVSTTAPTLSAASGETANTIATWSVTLNLPGDFYEFTINAVNEGTIDAMISSAGLTTTVTPNPNNANTPSQLPGYIKYTVTYEDGVAIGPYHKLGKALSGVPTKEAYKVRVEFTDNISPEQLNDIPEGGYSYIFTTQATYVQADENAIPKPVWVLPQGKTATTLALGDEVCVKDQCFNFIRYDGDNAVLFAEYNLNVGHDPKTSETFLQDKDLGTHGNVAFSYTNYWNGVISSYPADVYDDTYDTEPDFSDAGYMTTGYSIAYYVKEYKDMLEGNTYNAEIEDARLLTISEAENYLGCVPNSYTCPTTGATKFVTNTTYWLGSANMAYTVYSVYNYGGLGNGGNSGYSGGVRPVILVSKSNL